MLFLSKVLQKPRMQIDQHSRVRLAAHSAVAQNVLGDFAPVQLEDAGLTIPEAAEQCDCQIESKDSVSGHGPSLHSAARDAWTEGD